MRALSLLLLAACGTADVTDSAKDAVTDAAPDTPDDTDAPEVPPADSDAPGEDSAAPVDTDSSDDPPAQSGLVRFVVLGDAGEGNTTQFAVGAAIAQVCALRTCEFALYLGDNFYDDGVKSVDDDQFRTKFEEPYAALDFPFYVVLGNHDFGEIPLQFWRTDHQVSYTQYSTKWTMPDHFYAFDKAHATFLAMDTNKIMLPVLGGVQDQRTFVRRELRRAATAGQGWVLAFGHHPWRSNGKHGNAGNYEGIGAIDPTGYVKGQHVQDFFRQEFCRKIDLYLAGHDHNRQWLDPVCGVHLIVSGAGAKTTKFVHRDRNPTVWEDDATAGFTWIELDGNVATIAFYDRDGNLQHEGVLVK